MFLLLKKLYKIGLISPLGFLRFVWSLASEGTNLMALLKFSAGKYVNKIAVFDEKENVSYQELYLQSKNLAANLQQKFGLEKGNKAAFLCRGHADFIRAVCAASRIGVRIFLLNPEMTAEQLSALLERHKFDFIFYDDEAKNLINSGLKAKVFAVNEQTKYLESTSNSKIKRAFSGEIIVLTGGTTGTPKTARRKSSVFKFLNPFFALLTQLNLDEYQSVYIATPAFHGFGIAAIIIGIILGETMYFLPRFNAEKACKLIEKYQIEVVTVVPLMLQRMLRFDENSLKSLKCIISGGAKLEPSLAIETLEKLGDIIFNLYGTSEAGFSVIAKPEDLRAKPETIGRKIGGVNLKILDENDNELPNGKIGRICIKSVWAVKNGKDFVETGDLGFQDENGFLFLRGRDDEMIVSGGENVYPIELENILGKHPSVHQVAVKGIPDSEFGQRLKAFVVLRTNEKLSESEIKNWLQSRVARFQMPAKIEFLDELPTTAIGKINKKALK
ncbi:MAG TPA: AMP-binding protein [Pyrinomonadaceae bacterium]|nr:AMP-binding protein [Pyrinomonadaceae bacterium]